MLDSDSAGGGSASRLVVQTVGGGLVYSFLLEVVSEGSPSSNCVPVSGSRDCGCSSGLQLSDTNVLVEVEAAGCCHKVCVEGRAAQNLQVLRQYFQNQNIQVEIKAVRC